MKAAPIVIERTLKTPVARVWKALTNKDDMKKWYFDLPEFKAEVDFAFPDFAKKNFAKGWKEIVGTSLKKFVESV